MKLSDLHYIQLLDEFRQVMVSHDPNDLRHHYLKEIEHRLEQSAKDSELIGKIKEIISREYISQFASASINTLLSEYDHIANAGKVIKE